MKNKKGWETKSLEWIHNVREENYNETENLSTKELIGVTQKAGESVVRDLGLKIIRGKTQSVG